MLQGDIRSLKEQKKSKVSYLGKAMKVGDGNRSWHLGQGIGVRSARKSSLSLIYGRDISLTARAIYVMYLLL